MKYLGVFFRIDNMIRIEGGAQWSSGKVSGSELIIPGPTISRRQSLMCVNKTLVLGRSMSCLVKKLSQGFSNIALN